MAYENCIEVSEEIWKEFEDRKPGEITGRTGVLYQEGGYQSAVSGPDAAAFPGPAAGAGSRGAGGGAGIPALPHGLDVPVTPRPGGPGAGHQSPGITGRGDVFPGPPRPARRPCWKSVSAGTRPVFWPPGKNCTARSGPPAMPRWRWKSFPAWWWRSFYGRRTMSSPPRFRLPCRPTWTGSGSWMRSGAC